MDFFNGSHTSVRVILQKLFLLIFSHILDACSFKPAQDISEGIFKRKLSFLHLNFDKTQL